MQKVINRINMDAMAVAFCIITFVLPAAVFVAEHWSANDRVRTAVVPQIESNRINILFPITDESRQELAPEVLNLLSDIESGNAVDAPIARYEECLALASNVIRENHQITYWFAVPKSKASPSIFVVIDDSNSQIVSAGVVAFLC